MRVYAFAAAGTIGLNSLLIPAYGIVGAAIGTYTAMLCGNVFLYRLVQKRLGVSAFIFSLNGNTEEPAPPRRAAGRLTSAS